MKFYNSDMKEIELSSFEEGSVVIARVTRPMSKEEFERFCKNNNHLSELFSDKQISLVFCPDWIEFKEWK